MKIDLTLPDGSVRQVEKGTTALEVAREISTRLADEVLAAEVNGNVIDLERPIEENATLKLLKWEDEGGKHAFWHTSAHLMAEAIQQLYPGTQFGIGPAIDNGFYYDIDTGDVELKEADLKAIEDLMLQFAREKQPLVRKSITKSDALKFFGNMGQHYKNELIADLDDGTITTYTQGNFTDLCRGPHLPNTGYIKAVKLTSVAGAYWRGDEKRKQLTRIYGLTFP